MLWAAQTHCHSDPRGESRQCSCTKYFKSIFQRTEGNYWTAVWKKWFLWRIAPWIDHGKASVFVLVFFYCLQHVSCGVYQTSLLRVLSVEYFHIYSIIFAFGMINREIACLSVAIFLSVCHQFSVSPISLCFSSHGSFDSETCEERSFIEYKSIEIVYFTLYHICKHKHIAWDYALTNCCQ